MIRIVLEILTPSEIYRKKNYNHFASNCVTAKWDQLNIMHLFLSLSLYVGPTLQPTVHARARECRTSRHVIVHSGGAEEQRERGGARIERRRRRVAQYGHQFTRDRVRVHVGRRSRTNFSSADRQMSPRVL